MTSECTKCAKFIGAYSDLNSKDQVILGCDICKFGELMSQENFAERYLYMLAPNPFIDEREI